MATDPSTGGWALGPIGTPSQSTMAPMTPAQVAQIQQQTAAMAQPMSPASTTQQNSMFNGLFGSGGFGGNPAYLPPGSSIPGAVGPTSVGGAPIMPNTAPATSGGLY
jgi:hypothetical protein